LDEEQKNPKIKVDRLSQIDEEERFVNLERIKEISEYYEPKMILN
jgi:hypothetical protein